MLSRPCTPPRRVEAVAPTAPPPPASAARASGRRDMLERVAACQRAHAHASVDDVSPTPPSPAQPQHNASVMRARQALFATAAAAASATIVAAVATSAHASSDAATASSSPRQEQQHDAEVTRTCDGRGGGGVCTRSPSARQPSIDAHGMTDDDDDDKSSSNNESTHDGRCASNDAAASLSPCQHHAQDDNDDAVVVATLTSRLHEATTCLRALLHDHACALVHAAAAVQLRAWCAPHDTALVRRVCAQSDGSSDSCRSDNRGNSSDTDACCDDSHTIAVLPLLSQLSRSVVVDRDDTTTTSMTTTTRDDDTTHTLLLQRRLLDAYGEDVCARHAHTLRHITFDVLYTRMVALPVTAMLAQHGRMLLCMQRDLYMRSRIELFMQQARRCQFTTVHTSMSASPSLALTAARRAHGRVVTPSAPPPSTSSTTMLRAYGRRGLFGTMRRALQRSADVAAETATAPRGGGGVLRVCEVHVETAHEARQRRAAQQQHNDNNTTTTTITTTTAAATIHDGDKRSVTRRATHVLPRLRVTQLASATHKLHMRRRARVTAAVPRPPLPHAAAAVDEQFVSIAEHSSHSGGRGHE